MKVNEVISILNEFAPLAYAEDFDNTGLLVGDYQATVTGILVTLDTLETVIDEAIENNCNLIVSFHPIVFSGLKKITGKTYVERVVQKAIKHDIHIFAIHTALDNSFEGVNAEICNRLQLENKKILIPQKGTIKKLTTYAPTEEAIAIKEALFVAGAGNIGNYNECSYSTGGIGTFNGNENSNPTVGIQGRRKSVSEEMISVTFQKHLESKIIKALHTAHSYEEVAYEIVTLENNNQHIGMGMIGTLPSSLSPKEFLSYVKKYMNVTAIRHSAFLNNTITNVAVLGGSGAFAIDAAKAAGADAFITSDLKYHDFYKAENSIILIDIGHYESEQFTKDLLYAYLNKKISNFAIVLSQTNTNPVSYF